MSGTVNKVVLVGHVGKDPEIRTSQSGSRFASFSLATGESWTDKRTGERQERTEWHNISISNEAVVNVVEKYVRKGSKLYVEGQLAMRKWQDKDGNDRASTDVLVRPYRGEIKLLDSRRDGDDKGEQGEDERYRNPTGASSIKDLPGAKDANDFPDDLDDEIPL